MIVRRSPSQPIISGLARRLTVAARDFVTDQPSISRRIVIGIQQYDQGLNRLRGPLCGGLGVLRVIVGNSLRCDDSGPGPLKFFLREVSTLMHVTKISKREPSGNRRDVGLIQLFSDRKRGERERDGSSQQNAAPKEDPGRITRGSDQGQGCESSHPKTIRRSCVEAVLADVCRDRGCQQIGRW